MNKTQAITEDLNKIPNTLHKYFQISDKFWNVLKNNSIWFSDPFDFNDPYDCNLSIDTNNSYEEIYNYLKELNEKHKDILKMNGYVLSDDDLTNRANDFHSNKDGLKKLIRKVELRELDNKGITCFSMSDDILLMWSHYANSHKGICLTFDPKKDLDFFSFPFIVDYPDQYPIMNVIVKDESYNYKRYKQVLAMKSKDWEYEKEVRIVKDKRDHENYRGYIKFKKESLLSIKFGYKAEESDIDKIREIITQENYNNVKFYKAKLKERKFGIEYEEINKA